MQTIHVRERTGKDGTLTLRMPLGQPDAEFDVVVVAQPRVSSPTGAGWPPGYFDLFGSIADETFVRFVRPPQTL